MSLILTFIHTGSDQDWYITRNTISVSPGWVDGCCWGHSTDPFGGTCFSTGSMDMTSWTMELRLFLLFLMANMEN